MHRLIQLAKSSGLSHSEYYAALPRTGILANIYLHWSVVIHRRLPARLVERHPVELCPIRRTRLMINGTDYLLDLWTEDAPTLYAGIHIGPYSQASRRLTGDLVLPVSYVDKFKGEVGVLLQNYAIDALLMVNTGGSGLAYPAETGDDCTIIISPTLELASVPY